jgi:hypothetical protein
VGRLPRCRSGLVAGLALAGLALAGMALAGCGVQPAGSAGTAQPAGSAAGSLLATVSWAGPVLLPGGGSIQVSADVMHLPNYCIGAGLPTLRPSVTETATSVRIQVRAYRPDPAPPTANACAASGHEPVPVIAQLQQPLGRRSLENGAGVTVSVLDASTVPTPGYLPAGYRLTALGGSPTTGSYRIYERIPQPYDGTEFDLQIRQQHPPLQPLTEEQEVARGTVLGHPARVVQGGGERCVTWPDQPYVWSICAFGGNRPPEVSASQLLRIGNSLH